jgi:hypothetical protein
MFIALSFFIHHVLDTHTALFKMHSHFICGLFNDDLNGSDKIASNVYIKEVLAGTLVGWLVTYFRLMGQYYKCRKL